jgi:hypothetical protein
VSLRRVIEEESAEDYDFQDEDFDEALEDVIDSRGLTLSGDKNDADGLNNIGRRSLNKNGATLDASSKVLQKLLFSSDDKVALQSAKFIHERHAGRLEGNKDDAAPKIVFNIISEHVAIDPRKPSFLNPSPKTIEASQDGNPI